jgi:hypothetical protein
MLPRSISQFIDRLIAGAKRLFTLGVVVLDLVELVRPYGLLHVSIFYTTFSFLENYSPPTADSKCSP